MPLTTDFSHAHTFDNAGMTAWGDEKRNESQQRGRIRRGFEKLDEIGCPGMGLTNIIKSTLTRDADLTRPALSKFILIPFHPCKSRSEGRAHESKFHPENQFARRITKEYLRSPI